MTFIERAFDFLRYYTEKDELELCKDIVCFYLKNKRIDIDIKDTSSSHWISFDGLFNLNALLYEHKIPYNESNHLIKIRNIRLKDIYKSEDDFKNRIIAITDERYLNKNDEKQLYRLYYLVSVMINETYLHNISNDKENTWLEMYESFDKEYLYDPIDDKKLLNMFLDVYFIEVRRKIREDISISDLYYSYTDNYVSIDSKGNAK